MPKSPAWIRNLPPLFGIAVLGGLALFYGGMPQSQGARQERLRLAYFPNVTHAPVVVGVAQGAFQKAFGDQVFVDVKVFSDGPTAMEALLAGEVDIAYVGPGPAINTFLKSKGEAVRLIAEACSGGAGLIARKDAPVQSVRDLDGKKVAVPQIGSTQDISLRHFLTANGLRPAEKGGTVQVLPMKPADTLPLFQAGELDAAWVPEPWIARLTKEANARLVVDERDLWPDRKFPTTVIVVRKAYLDQNPQRVEQMLAAHLQVVADLEKNPQAGQKTMNAELKRLTNKALAEDVLQTAWSRVTFTSEPNIAALQTFGQWAGELGYLPSASPDLTALVEPVPLKQARLALAAAAR